MNSEQLCCLCRQPFQLLNLPRIIPNCQHSACTHCLKSIVSASNLQNQIRCQFCGKIEIIKELDLEYFPKDISLIKKIKEKLKAIENVVEEKKIATDSQEKSTKDLNITQESRNDKEKEQKLAQQQKICQIHKKQMDIICVTDRQRICALCAIFGLHKDHKFKTIQQLKREQSDKEDEFKEFLKKKQNLDGRINSSEFKEKVVRMIGEKKDNLVLSIKQKFAQLYSDIHLAEKKAFEDVIKNFKMIYQKINMLIKEENDSQKKYKEWRIKCQDLFHGARQSKTIEDKVYYYFGGPLELCSEGDIHLKRIEGKIDSNIHLIESLISQIKIVENTSLSGSIFNYITIFVEEMPQSEFFNNVSLEFVGKKLNQSNHQEISSRKSLKVEFTSESLLDIKKQTKKSTTPKKSKSKEKVRLSDKKSPPKIQRNEYEQKNLNVERVVSEYLERQNVDTLDLSNYGMSDVQIYEVLKYLKGVKKIKGLKLSKNRLTNDGLMRIMEYIPLVTNLNLSFNFLTEDVLTFFIINRQKLSSIRIINLSNNKVNERKAKTVMEELKKIGIIVTI